MAFGARLGSGAAVEIGRAALVGRLSVPRSWVKVKPHNVPAANSRPLNDWRGPEETAAESDYLWGKSDYLY